MHSPYVINFSECVTASQQDLDSQRQGLISASYALPSAARKQLMLSAVPCGAVPAGAGARGMEQHRHILVLTHLHPESSG